MDENHLETVKAISSPPECWAWDFSLGGFLGLFFLFPFTLLSSSTFEEPAIPVDVMSTVEVSAAESSLTAESITSCTR